ncbi:RHS repeat protein [Salmonella enterica]|nr:RHS repeat protein [Salmonella enterica]ECC1022424.1 RHS repeat protein [Salmonella enterica]EFQ6193078.1 RHS repeat protein [Salmonella enterica]EFR2556907.1 RHS repeat protein [Salmonella enterica]EJD3071215.1 RHS domain-containing protein [Salmonella enterica]
MAGQLEERAEPERKIHLYHCDHRGLPVALINSEGAREWSAEYDVWGNRQKEENPQQLEQLLRLPGQQYDEETGLYYNRYRYYNPEQGRYITQDPIGLRGGWNLYAYPLNPVSGTDPLGLVVDAIPWGAATPTAVPSLVAGTVIGGAVLDAALAGFEADVAVPEPTDGAWPKWAGWAVVIAAAAAFTYLTCASGDDSTEDSEDSDAGYGEKGDSTDSGHGVSGAEDNESGSDSDATTVDDLIATSSKGDQTTGRSRLYERPGGIDEANKDFDNLSPSDVKDIDNNYVTGRVGTLPDGRTVIVRDGSSDGRPTLEVQSGKNKIKFRYD